MKVISLALIQDEGIQIERARKGGTGTKLHQGLLTLETYWAGAGPVWGCIACGGVGK